jgi:hypothetical protein
LLGIEYTVLAEIKHRNSLEDHYHHHRYYYYYKLVIACLSYLEAVEEERTTIDPLYSS